MKTTQHVKVGVTPTRRMLYDWVKTDTGGHSRRIGSETANVEVWVDVQRIVDAIGHKAMENKSGETKIQGGAIILRANNRKRSEEAT